MVYVNENCIGCGVCESIAPMIFKVDGGMSKVIKQPDETELEAVDVSVASCPVSAIIKE